MSLSAEPAGLGFRPDAVRPVRLANTARPGGAAPLASVRFAVLASLLLPPAAGHVAAAAPPAATVTRRIEPDEGFELCQTLSQGQILHYRFDSTLALIFAAHYHQGDDASTLWRRDELRREEGDIKASAGARYCLYWNNYQASTLRLDYTIEVR